MPKVFCTRSPSFRFVPWRRNATVRARTPTTRVLVVDIGRARACTVSTGVTTNGAMVHLSDWSHNMQDSKKGESSHSPKTTAPPADQPYGTTAKYQMSGISYIRKYGRLTIRTAYIAKTQLARNLGFRKINSR